MWNVIRCSHQGQFEAHLERSKSVLLDVRLHDLQPRLLEALVPHTSRLAALTVRVSDSSDLDRIARRLRNPIPTLRKLAIVGISGTERLELPFGIGDDCFMHVKKLELQDVSSFRAPLAFPYVTELTWCVGPHRGGPVHLSRLLDTLEQLPVLEQVDLVFRTSAIGPSPNVVTLPHVQRMSLCRSGNWKVGIPPVLEFLKLPKLISLIVDAVPTLPRSFPALPATSFGEHLPNLAELPEMEVYARGETGRVSFRSPSQAVLEYRGVARPLGDMPYPYRHDRRLWGGLSLHSVRRLIVTLDKWEDEWEDGIEEVWLVCLLRDLRSLEHLELEGYCGGTVRCLRRLMMRRKILLGIKTLTVRSGAYEIRQAMRLKDIADGLGLEIIVTCVPGPEVSDTEGQIPDADGLSEDWDLSDDGEGDDGSS